MPVIDLQGVYPAQLHHPAMLAQSNADPTHVYPLLFDTGLVSECMFHVNQTDAYRQFIGGGGNNIVNIQLAPVSGVQAITLGTALPLPAPPPVFARAASLRVELRRHANAISHQYLLGPQGPAPANPYPQRLLAFWSTAPGVPQTPVNEPDLPQLRNLFAQPGLQVYAVPITLVDPNNAPAMAAVPQAANQVLLSVMIENRGIFTPLQLQLRDGSMQQLLATVDTGASYTLISSTLAWALGLNDSEDAQVVIPQVDFTASNPLLSLRNLPAVVYRQNEHMIIGSSLFDRFTRVVFDLGQAGPVQGQPPLIGGTIRLIP